MHIDWFRNKVGFLKPWWRLRTSLKESACYPTLWDDHDPYNEKDSGDQVLDSVLATCDT
jgi:hypothetical protein